MRLRLCPVACFLALFAGSLPAQEAPAVLERYDFETRTSRFELPGRLDEVSGLAVTTDGRLFAHDDERATVHEIDPASGRTGKRFSLDDPPVRGDFEGIAIVGERFFLVTSRGLLYEFREGADRQDVPYRVTDTTLGAACEVEGLEYDEAENALLFACKVSLPDRGTIVVHRFSLDPAQGLLPAIQIPRRDLAAFGLDPAFQPSAIAVSPTGTLVLASAVTEALIEVGRSGQVYAGIQLSGGRHPQTEGLAFEADGTLLLADERGRQRARITSYAPVPSGARP